jgi:cohesin complex subunit SA-1/2
MQTSPIRPLRHTSTYIALKFCSALCDVVSEVSKDLGLKQRQKEAEEKRGGKKVKEAEKKVTEAHERKTKLERYMQDSVDV